MLQIISIIGAGIVLLAFYLAITHKVEVDSVQYQVLNFIGAILLLTSALIMHNVGFVLLNGIWGFLALRKLRSLRK